MLVGPGEYVITEPLDFNRLRDPNLPGSPPLKNLVLTSERGAEETVIRMSEAPSDPNRASVIVFTRGEGRTSRLQGLTLTGGMGVEGSGGAVFISASHPVVSDCRIQGNGLPLRNLRAGGGVYCARARVDLVNCAIEGNSAGAGGGVYCGEGTSVRIENCAISGNAALWGGGGITAVGGTSLKLNRTTVAGNWAGGWSPVGGLYLGGGFAAELASCIVWGNTGDSIVLADAKARVHHSCIEGPLWAGTGNIDVDPLFCGWGPRGEVWADATLAEAGDGSPEKPYASLGGALGSFEFSLSASSPCLGTGQGGVNMGADLGTCEAQGQSAMLVHLAPGTYHATGVVSRQNVSLEGAGVQDTVLTGSVGGLRTGTTLSQMRLTNGDPYGLWCGPGESPEVREVEITWS
ncbi:MAG: right-handed parallel beta-helix repeat-containing protein, partial [Candidatus Methylomirabilales bacterium]